MHAQKFKPSSRRPLKWRFQKFIPKRVTNGMSKHDLWSSRYNSFRVQRASQRCAPLKYHKFMSDIKGTRDQTPAVDFGSSERWSGPHSSHKRSPKFVDTHDRPYLCRPGERQSAHKSLPLIALTWMNTWERWSQDENKTNFFHEIKQIFQSRAFISRSEWSKA